MKKKQWSKISCYCPFKWTADRRRKSSFSKRVRTYVVYSNFYWLIGLSAWSHEREREAVSSYWSKFLIIHMGRGGEKYRPQSTQSAGPVRFLTFCSISIILLASLVAGNPSVRTVLLVQSSRECTPPYLSTGISKSAPARGRGRVGPALYVFSLLGTDCTSNPSDDTSPYVFNAPWGPFTLYTEVKISNSRRILLLFISVHWS